MRNTCLFSTGFISNFIYENENSRFSLPQIPSEKPSCPSLSADASFISENRSIVNVTHNIFQDAEILSPIPCQSFPQTKQNLSCNEYILSYDGKGVAQGFRGPNFGDISLWGLEGPSTLEEEQKRLDEELKFSHNLVTDVDEESLISKRQFL